MRRLLSFLSVIFFASSCHPQGLPPLEKAANDNTVLWEVTGRDMDKPFYVFGTMHLLCSEDAKLSANVKEIMKRADLIYFELDMDNLAGMMMGLKYMQMNNGVKLKDLVTAEEYARIKTYFNKNGALPFSMVENYKPMLLAATVSEGQMDCQAQSGIEMMMMEENKSKKEILGLESMQDQAGIFDSIPYKDQAKELLKLVDSSATGKDNSKKELEELVNAYKKQELKKIEALMAKSEPGLQDYMDLLLYKRNRNWVQQMNKLTGKKTIIFAVGAGHLVGNLGVLELLKKEGYTLKPLKN